MVEEARHTVDDVACPYGRDGIELVLGPGDLGVGDGRLGGRAELVDEGTGLGREHQVVAGALDDQEGRCVCVNAGQGRAAFVPRRVLSLSEP